MQGWLQFETGELILDTQRRNAVLDHMAEQGRNTAVGFIGKRVIAGCVIGKRVIGKRVIGKRVIRQVCDRQVYDGEVCEKVSV